MDIEQQPQTVTVSTSGITMEIDLHQMLTAIDPNGRWLHYNPEIDEDVYQPSSLADQIAEVTAIRLAKEMRKEVRDLITEQVSATIQAEVEGIIRAHLEGEVQSTDEWGQPKGGPVPLTQMIVKAATDGMNKPASYNGPTRLQKMIEEAVGGAFKTELRRTVDEAKAAAVKAVQESAADVIRDTIQRASRGL